MKRSALIAIIVFLAAGAAYAQDTKYTNESVARVSFVDGKTFVQRASDLGFEEAALNMPVSEGDRIGTTDGRAEVHFGRGNYIRLDSETKIDVLNLPKMGDESARIRVWSGSIYLVVGSLRKEKAIEIHSADSSFYVLDKGIYRVDVRENRETEIQVYEGLIEAAGEGGSTLLKASQRLVVAEGRFLSKPSTFIAVANDGFDKFNESRNAVAQKAAAKSYLPEELGDFEAELQEYGEWVYMPPYGNVWVPGGVDDNWRPYYDGRWTWLPLTGWTWWPYEPWGWSTFHYGRWHWGVGFGWYWIPTAVWGPAWVSWWWDPYYYAWAPLSYWGYPGIVMGGAYYGNYYGPYYPYASAALTVIRKDHLKAPSVSANALRSNSLTGLNKMSLTNKSLDVRPAGTKITVQPIDGNKVLLRRDEGTTGLTKDRGVGREAIRPAEASTAASPRVIRKPSGTGGEAKPAVRDGAAAGGSPTVKGERQAEKGKAAGTTKTTGSAERKTVKKDGESVPASGAVSGYSSSRTVHGYPSSPSIQGPRATGDGGAARSRSSVGPSSSGSSSRPSSVRSSGSSSKSSQPRTGMSSGRSSSSRGSSSVSRGSSSSGSRGSSSSGSRGSSSSGSRSSGGGGSVRKK